VSWETCLSRELMGMQRYVCGMRRQFPAQLRSVGDLERPRVNRRSWLAVGYDEHSERVLWKVDVGVYIGRLRFISADLSHRHGHLPALAVAHP
jgi:hypothetical protein